MRTNRAAVSCCCRSNCTSKLILLKSTYASAASSIIWRRSSDCASVEACHCARADFTNDLCAGLKRNCCVVTLKMDGAAPRDLKETQWSRQLLNQRPFAEDTDSWLQHRLRRSALGQPKRSMLLRYARRSTRPPAGK